MKKSENQTISAPRCLADESAPLLTLTEAAETHFASLLAQEPAGTHLRIFVTQPGTPKAEVGITYCPAGEHQPTDHPLIYADFTLFVDGHSKRALQEGLIDYKSNGQLGGQLSVKAPFIKGEAPPENAPLADRIEYLIRSEINPNLAGHGGKVSLIEITEDQVVLLQFGGGCHGCGMANVTLKTGIEKVILERYPEVKAVRDVTDHAQGTNPYY